jgi:hypothetical protein
MLCIGDEQLTYGKPLVWFLTALVGHCTRFKEGLLA